MTFGGIGRNGKKQKDIDMAFDLTSKPFEQMMRNEQTLKAALKELHDLTQGPFEQMMKDLDKGKVSMPTKRKRTKK